MVKETSLLIWDTEKPLPPNHKEVILWQNFESSKENSIYSIPKLIEKYSVELKSKYLKFIYNLGETELEGKRVVDHLEIRSGFSYWWMTLLVEKCNYSKSPQIDNVIKLMAFEKWFQEKRYNHISFFSSNKELAKSIELWCLKKNIKFNWKQETIVNSYQNGYLRHIFNHLPLTIQAIISLCIRLYSNWPLKKSGLAKWKKSKAKITFVSYLFNLEPEFAKNGLFESNYWTALPKFLMKNKIESNWLHIYEKNSILPNAFQAKKMVNQFNLNHFTTQSHVTLDSFLSLRVILNVIRDFFWLIRLKEPLGNTIKKKSDYYWPLLKTDFLISISGSVASKNLLFLNLFEKAMKLISKQDIGFYLQENQGWEFGLVHSWRKSKHSNNLIGIPHSTIRFWDMRYFFEPDCYKKSNNCKLPLPDFVGMNGRDAKKKYLEGKYPKEQLIELEALRYIHLQNKTNSKNDTESEKKIVLILGDCLEKFTIKMMDLLQESLPLIEDSKQFFFKPHPTCKISLSKYKDLELVVKNSHLHSLIDKCSTVLTSSGTSGAVDAYCIGKRVITVLDGKSLNQSPLKDKENVSFVYSIEELANKLNTPSKVIYMQKKINDYFYLDTELPRWRKLILNLFNKDDNPKNLQNIAINQ